ncbi:MAG: hypothetical protein HQK86_04345 [Nitrospinae bacterium]|nr:hypothetical protein [Nitrospinota bacterium]
MVKSIGNNPDKLACVKRPCWSILRTTCLLIGVVVVNVILVLLNDVVVILPLMLTASVSEVTVKGSEGLDRLTVRVVDIVAVSPLGIFILALFVIGAFMPNRGSGLNPSVVTVPSGLVVTLEALGNVSDIVIAPQALHHFHFHI